MKAEKLTNTELDEYVSACWDRAVTDLELEVVLSKDGAARLACFAYARTLFDLTDERCDHWKHKSGGHWSQGEIFEAAVTVYAQRAAELIEADKAKRKKTFDQNHPRLDAAKGRFFGDVWKFLEKRDSLDDELRSDVVHFSAPNDEDQEDDRVEDRILGKILGLNLVSSRPGFVKRIFVALIMECRKNGKLRIALTRLLVFKEKTEEGEETKQFLRDWTDVLISKTLLLKHEVSTARSWVAKLRRKSSHWVRVQMEKCREMVLGVLQARKIGFRLMKNTKGQTGVNWLNPVQGNEGNELV